MHRNNSQLKSVNPALREPPQAIELWAGLKSDKRRRAQDRSRERAEHARRDEMQEDRRA